MENKTVLQLVVGWLEYSYEDFQVYLEEMEEIEGSEAELLIAEIKKMME